MTHYHCKQSKWDHKTESQALTINIVSAFLFYLPLRTDKRASASCVPVSPVLKKHDEQE